MELLGKSLPTLTNLKTFIWDAQYAILPWLLDSLHKYHPQCKLYARFPGRQDTALTLTRLRNSCSLFSLDVTFLPGQFQAFAELQKVASACPNLKDLSIMLTSSNTSTNPTSLPSFRTLDTPFTLRSLELNGNETYGFEAEEFWPKFIEWRRLERLSINDFKMLGPVITELSHLRSLQLNVEQSSIEMPFVFGFLLGCQRLENLDITGALADMKGEVLSHLGKTLTSLRLHAREESRWAPSIYTPDRPHIREIGASCKKLRSFGLDLYCMEGWVSSPKHARNQQYQLLRS